MLIVVHHKVLDQVLWQAAAVSENEYFEVNEKNAVILSLAGALTNGAAELREFTPKTPPTPNA